VRMITPSAISRWRFANSVLRRISWLRRNHDGMRWVGNGSANIDILRWPSAPEPKIRSPDRVTGMCARWWLWSGSANIDVWWRAAPDMRRVIDRMTWVCSCRWLGSWASDVHVFRWSATPDSQWRWRVSADADWCD